jgi:hypothetical protein
MKVFGVKRSLDSFRWDLLYLLSQLSSDKRADVAALALPVETAMNQLNVRRLAAEQAQADAIMAAALVVKRDGLRDQLLVEMGGVALAGPGAGSDRPSSGLGRRPSETLINTL